MAETFCRDDYITICLKTNILIMTGLIVLIYNNDESIRDFVDSFERFNTEPAKYIIVDNGSKNDISNSVSTFLSGRFSSKGYLECDDDYVCEGSLPYCTFIRSKTNSGFSGGNNKGLRLAYADDEIDNVLVINDDVIFVCDVIPELVRNLHTLPNAGMVCPISLCPNGEIDYDCVRKMRTKWQEFVSMFHYVFSDDELILRKHPEYLEKDYIEIEPPIGPHILFDKNTLRRVGGYDDNVFLYHEEYILYQKYKALGLKNYAIPHCRVIHVGSVSTKKDNSKKISRFGLESTFYYYKTYFNLNFFEKLALHLCYFLGKKRI